MTELERANKLIKLQDELNITYEKYVIYLKNNNKPMIKIAEESVEELKDEIKQITA